MSGGTQGYVWHWGDGTISDGATPNHIYAQSGAYNVCLVVWNDANNCEDEFCQMITVQIPTSECTAHFVYEISNLGQLFVNGTSSQVSGGTQGYIWYWGDGTTSDGATPHHTYAQSGVYNVCLVVWNDANNCEDEFCQMITVQIPEINCTNFVAAFTYEINGNIISLQSTTANAASWLWTLNNVVFSDNSTPATEIQSGVNSVCLSVTNTEGCTNMICEAVEIPAADAIELPVNMIQEKMNLNWSTANENKTASLQIYNTLGQLIYQEKLNYQSVGLQLYELDTKFLAQGCYIIKIDFGKNKMATNKFYKLP
ncbi:MAG: PKD domain-containing protein [Sphingobacteriales bacterium]|nr:PKD domain-containing protein [Sphingobacteriales bacterium]